MRTHLRVEGLSNIREKPSQEPSIDFFPQNEVSISLEWNGVCHPRLPVRSSHTLVEFPFEQLWANDEDEARNLFSLTRSQIVGLHVTWLCLHIVEAYLLDQRGLRAISAAKQHSWFVSFQSRLSSSPHKRGSLILC